MEITAIILASGEGSRLGPLSFVCSKQLLTIYDKPMIFYSVSMLILCKVNKLIIVTKTRDLEVYKRLLGDGKQLGVTIQYVVQDNSLGIPHAIGLCSNFIKTNKFLVCLGDNIFHGSGMLAHLTSFLEEDKFGAKIFLKYVYDPRYFGVAKINTDGTIIRMVEKPRSKVSNYAVTGIYGFDKTIFKKIKELNLSPRGELEIIDILNNYLKHKNLDYFILGRGISWLDTGTCSNLNKASNFIEAIQTMNNAMIGSPEESSYRMKLINKKQLNNLSKSYGKSEYGKNLKKVCKE